MLTKLIRQLAAAALWVAPFVLSAATLKVGDPAPALDVAAWLKGSPVTAFEPGKIYLVEFWATWCSPCNAAMPKLSELQKQHPDRLVIIGVDVREHLKESAAVQPFVTAYVAKKGEKMAYTVGMDEPTSHPMYTNWLVAADTTGIPATFIVDVTGHIAFIGHPFKENMLAFSDEFTTAFNRIMSGATDYSAGRAIQDSAKVKTDEWRWQLKQQEPVKALLAKGDFQAAIAEADRLGATDPKTAAALFEVKLVALTHLDVPAARALLKQEIARGGMVGRFPPGKWARMLAYLLMLEKDLSDDACRFAVEIANQSILDGPGEPTNWESLAQAKYRLHEKNAAVEAQQHAIAIAVRLESSDYDIDQMKLKLAEYERTPPQ